MLEYVKHICSKIWRDICFPILFRANLDSFCVLSSYLPFWPSVLGSHASCPGLQLVGRVARAAGSDAAASGAPPAAGSLRRRKGPGWLRVWAVEGEFQRWYQVRGLRPAVWIWAGGFEDLFLNTFFIHHILCSGSEWTDASWSWWWWILPSLGRWPLISSWGSGRRLIPASSGPAGRVCYDVQGDFFLLVTWKEIMYFELLYLAMFWTGY